MFAWDEKNCRQNIAQMNTLTHTAAFAYNVEFAACEYYLKIVMKANKKTEEKKAFLIG